VSTYRAKQGKKYTTDELDFLKEKVCESNMGSAEIANKFFKKFNKSGRKLDNLKRKINEIAKEENIDLKEQVREEARGKLGDSKMAPANVLASWYPFVRFLYFSSSH